MTRYRRKARRFLVHNVLHVDDSPHRLALGVGLATLVAFLPLVGIQTILAVALAALFRANKAVCVPVVWITNPITLWPIYGGCLALGRFILPGGTAHASEVDTLSQLATRTGGFSDLFTLAFWGDFFTWAAGLGVELWVGCIIVGVVFGVASYFASRWAVAWYREKYKHLIARRKARIFRAKSRRARLTAREPA